MVQKTKTVLRTTVRVLKQCMCPHDEMMCPCIVDVASKQAKKKASKQAKKKKVTNNGTCPQTMHVST